MNCWCNCKPHRSARRIAPLATLIALVGAASCYGQKPPEAGYVFPPTMRIGQVNSVQLGGYDWTPDLQFFVLDQRLILKTDGKLTDFFVPEPPYWFGEKGMMPALPLPREVDAQLKIPAGMAPGIYRWQVASANGPSACSAFYVSNQHEIQEDRFRDDAQQLAELPVGVSGRLSKIAEVDAYEFTAKSTGLITVELMARRLGSDFHGLLEIVDEQGKRLAHAADTQGIDLSVSFEAEATRRYLIRLHDIDFRGHRSFVYRLAVTPGPKILATIPAAINADQATDVLFVGMGLNSGGAKLESLTKTISAAEPAIAKHRPFAGKLRYQLETPRGTLTRAIPLTAAPVLPRLSAPNESPRSIPVPGAVTNVMKGDGESRYRFAGRKGDQLRLSAVSHALGGNLDLEITILDESGKQRATVDDAAGTQDAILDFKVPDDADYTCLVRDLSGRTFDQSSIYHLEIVRIEPSFSLEIPQQVAVPLGGQSALTVKAVREGGFAGEIKLEASGLPRGVTFADSATIPPGKSSLKLTVAATADAEVVACPIQLTGHATINGNEVVRHATSIATGNLCPRDPANQRVDRTLLAVTMTPPFAVEVIDKNRQRAVHRGTTYPAPLMIKRQEGFEDVVTLQMASRQGRQRQGIRGGIVDVPGGTEFVEYPCFMPEWLATDRTSRMVVHGVGRVVDPKGQPRFIMAPANARITMILEGALLKLSHLASEMTVAPGESAEIPIEVFRSDKLQTNVSIQAIAPPEVKDLVSTSPLSLPPGESRGSLAFSTRHDDRLAGRWTFLLRATTVQSGKWPVVSQCEVELEFQEK